MANVSDWCFYWGFVGYGEFGIFTLTGRRGSVHVSGLICLDFVLTGSYCVLRSLTLCIYE